MKAEVEVYKGIEFVRLSALPKEQAKAIRASAFGKKTIKILRDTELLSDCLPYSFYVDWYHETTVVTSAFPVADAVAKAKNLKFALE